MSAPTPAAVRASLEMTQTTASTESHRVIDEMAREKGSKPSVIVATILSDHIRAVAQEMRAESIAMQVNTHDPFVEPGTREAEIAAAKRLAVFADKLEGKA